MGLTALILATILYMVIAVDFLMKKQYGYALVWFGYVIANFGMIIMAIEISKKG